MRMLTLAAVVLLVTTAIAVAQQPSTPLTYQSPLPSATAVSAQTHIILRPGPTLDRASVDVDLLTVIGSTSGACPGTLTLARDGRTMTFRPERPFAPGETVTVALERGVRTRAGDDVGPTRFAFMVDRTPTGAIGRVPSFLELELTEAAELMPAEALSAAEPTALDSVFPHLEVTVNTRPAPGEVFITPMILGRNLPYKPHVAMVDNSGATVFRQRTGKYALDFKKQWNGQYSWYSNDEAVFLFHDSTWSRQRVVTAEGGAYNDGHDLLLLPDGNVLIMVIYPRFVDMSKLVEGGDTAAVVLDIALQELDPDNNLVFEWRSVDHFTVFDAPHTSLTAKTIDHIHPNSIHIDDDGNILLSARHLDAVTKISRETGEIIWHLGGRNNQFRFVNDSTGFGYQHDARRLPNGNILLYDNGNHRQPAYSRAVEYRLDMDSMTATVVWEYRHPDGIFAPAMGGAQRLPNGNTMIGWGVSNYITEVDSAGTIVFEMKFPRNVCSYRARRFVADEVTVLGVPVSPADLAAGEPRATELVWDATARTTSYSVELATDRLFESVVVAADTTGLRVTVPELAAHTVYFWRVRPNGPAHSDWSPVRAFMTAGVWAPQLLLAPANGSDGWQTPPTLQWESYPRATAYRLQLSRDSSFADSVTQTTRVTETRFWLSEVDTAAHYYWRVAPLIEEIAGPWSDRWAFSTDSTLTSPTLAITLVTPALDTSITRPGIEFAWSSSLALDLFRLRIARDAGLTDVVVDTTVHDSQMRIDGRALAPRAYWWWVIGTDLDGRGEQYGSAPSRFTVATWLRIEPETVAASVGAEVRPTPSSAGAELVLELDRASTLSVVLTDAAGRLVATETRDLTAGAHSIPLPIDALAPGVYTCTVRTATGVLHRRLVVAR